MRISPAGLELSLTSSLRLSYTNFASKILPYRASAQIALFGDFLVSKISLKVLYPIVISVF